MNTLFALSEGCHVHTGRRPRVDQGKIKAGWATATCTRCIRTAIDEAHLEGKLKAEIVGPPRPCGPRSGRAPRAPRPRRTRTSCSC